MDHNYKNMFVIATRTIIYYATVMKWIFVTRIHTQYTQYMGDVHHVTVVYIQQDSATYKPCVAGQ